ncbi:multicopper oxidase domain-containing protein [Streptomyces sp. NPDC047971]|uniref:multicopper oxidase domain-containing protein n=1 Tax=Streptomyces sp. NPDC047971 TaxID=3154499 RepID=UPI0033FEAA41
MDGVGSAPGRAHLHGEVRHRRVVAPCARLGDTPETGSTTVTRGTSETWTVRNDDGTPHNSPVHDGWFRILGVNGEQPPARPRGAEDTVVVPSGSTVQLALRLDGPADPDTPYLRHCHPLSREDAGTTGRFVVVEKGRGPGKARTPPAHAGH